MDKVKMKNIYLRLVALLFFLGFACKSVAAPDSAVISNSLEEKILSDKQLLPEGFIEMARASGDLNKDGRSDIALIARQTDTNKQIVLLFLGDAKNGYRFWKLGGRHFTKYDPDFLDEGGVGGLDIKNGVLTVSDSTGLSMGGWDAGHCTQKWRNEAKGLRLIGLTRLIIDRKCACGYTVDVNYVTGKTIRKSDKGEDGNQLEGEVITEVKAAPKVILWDSFDYDKACYPKD